MRKDELDTIKKTIVGYLLKTPYEGYDNLFSAYRYVLRQSAADDEDVVSDLIVIYVAAQKTYNPDRSPSFLYYFSRVVKNRLQILFRTYPSIHRGFQSVDHEVPDCIHDLDFQDNLILEDALLSSLFFATESTFPFRAALENRDLSMAEVGTLWDVSKRTVYNRISSERLFDNVVATPDSTYWETIDDELLSRAEFSRKARLVPIQNLRFLPDSRASSAVVERLIPSLLQNGQIEPVLVQDKTLLVVHGVQRIAALREAHAHMAFVFTLPALHGKDIPFLQQFRARLCGATPPTVQKESLFHPFANLYRHGILPLEKTDLIRQLPMDIQKILYQQTTVFSLPCLYVLTASVAGLDRLVTLLLRATKKNKKNITVHLSAFVKKGKQNYEESCFANERIEPSITQTKQTDSIFLFLENTCHDS